MAQNNNQFLNNATIIIVTTFLGLLALKYNKTIYDSLVIGNSVEWLLILVPCILIVLVMTTCGLWYIFSTLLQNVNKKKTCSISKSNATGLRDSKPLETNKEVEEFWQRSYGVAKGNSSIDSSNKERSNKYAEYWRSKLMKEQEQMHNARDLRLRYQVITQMLETKNFISNSQDNLTNYNIECLNTNEPSDTAIGNLRQSKKPLKEKMTECTLTKKLNYVRLKSSEIDINNKLTAVIGYSKMFETALEKYFNAHGRGLHEKISVVEYSLSPELVKNLRKVAVIRNKTLHEDGYSVENLQDFVDICDRITKDLEIAINHN